MNDGSYPQTDLVDAASELDWGLTEVDLFSSALGWRRLLTRADPDDAESDWLQEWDDTEGELVDRRKELSPLMLTVGYISTDWGRIDPGQKREWQEWSDGIWNLLNRIGDPLARTPAVQAVAAVADSVASSYLDTLEILATLLDQHVDAQLQISQLESQVKQLEERAASLRQDNCALEEANARLKAARARLPKKAKVVIPSKTVVIRSAAQQQAMRLIGDEGLGRSWRIAKGIVETQGLEENSARNAITALTKKGLVDDYRRDGKSIRWKYAAGGSRRLVVLTERGTAWYREVYDREPVESEILRAARQHRSAVHGVGVLEAQDHLRAVGYRVDDDPEAILAQDESRWGRRQEPDLLVWMDGHAWPVEVQREVSQRLLDKWEKALSLNERLVLILFNVQHREKQETLLRQDKRVRRLRRGIIRLTSLEEMETGDWGWTVLNLPFRR
jgi:hypothetical protein